MVKKVIKYVKPFKDSDEQRSELGEREKKSPTFSNELGNFSEYEEHNNTHPKRQTNF